MDTIKTTIPSEAAQAWPTFESVAMPTMVALYPGNGSGTKLFQGFLDNHPQIYMIPGYPLMYLYPNWHQWRTELADNWTWEAIIDAFCIQHASVIDTRRIPGFDGLSTLGRNRDEYLAIDETLFRKLLNHLLANQEIRARTFLLAIHFAYAFCRGEDLSRKRVLLYHIHVHEYVRDFLIPDFPDALILTMTRDPRANLRGRYWSSEVAVDDTRLNRTDSLVFRRRTYITVMRYMLEGLDILAGFPQNQVRVIRHEDLHDRPHEVMVQVANFIGIEDHSSLHELTFGGRLWWGDKVYGMEPMNHVNPRVVSQEWKKTLCPVDWFMIEGLFYNYMKKYSYYSEKYKNDDIADKIILFLSIVIPSHIERQTFISYLTPTTFLDFLKSCWAEATGATPLKDYSFNSYYRHKWNHKDLQLWKGRWFVRLLVRWRDRAAGHSASSVWAKAWIDLLELQYIAINVVRYAFSIALFPLMLAKRWTISMGALSRMARRANYLPDPL